MSNAALSALRPSPLPALLMVAPNGARKTKADHPALPITPGEVARTAAECLEAGARAIHLHVRDREGRHTLDPEAYRAMLNAVRDAVGERMALQITTESAGRYAPADQIACVEAVRPEAVSIAIRELFADPAFEAEAAAFLERAAARDIAIQYILHEAAEVKRFNALRRRGLVPDTPASLLFVLGRYQPAQTSSPTDLLPFLDDAAQDIWMVCAFGPFEGACALTALGLGGHSRVGFENNIALMSGATAGSNAELVSQVAGGAPLMGRRLASADEAGRILGRR